jgi:hypothetical protein
MGYKVLGYVVWNGAKWFVRHRYGQYVPSRRVTAAAVVALGVGALVVAGSRRD